MAIDWAVKHKNAPGHITDPEAGFVIYISFLTSKTEWWISSFRNSQNKACHFYHDPNAYWKAIAIGVYSLEVMEVCKKLLPSLDPEKYLFNPTLTPAPQPIAPRATPTPSVGAILKKVISKVPKRPTLTVTEYVLRNAPSNSYELIYSTTLGCCRNKRSSKGKKVYPYGQRYIAKLTRLSLRTTERAWSWLCKKGIFNKARNENPKEHHCSLWYVCTSMKQVPYFRDPENRHRKT